MTTHQYVRFDPDLTVPVDAIQLVSTHAGTECLWLRGMPEPFPLGPETAQRWRDFANGSREFPVNTNGVLDLAGNEEAQYIAQQVLNGEPERSVPVFGADPPETGLVTAPAVAPKIDFSKVRSRMR